MKPEQLNWTDKQWAGHLQCPVQDVPKFKKYLESNFWLGIWQDRESGLKYAQVQVRHDTPSGCIRFIPMVSSEHLDLPLDKIVEHTNNTFIPSLVLKPDVAKMRGVPEKILHMLHINNKQK